MTDKNSSKVKKRFYIPESITTFGTIALLVVLGFYVASQFIKPGPPGSFKLAVGAKGGAYHETAQKYVDFLKSHRVDVEFVETAGALENLKMLNSGQVDAALIQSGLGAIAPHENVEALGALYYEPLWVFLKPGFTWERLNGMKGKTLSIGGQGSGTRVVATQILADNGITAQNTTFKSLSMPELFNQVKAGSLDAAFIVGGYSDPKIQKFLKDPDIQLMHFERAQTYAKKYAHLAHIVLPEGLADLERNLPRQDIHMISPSAILAVNKDFYGALKSLLTHMAHDVHDVETAFSTIGDFPTIKHVDLDFAEEAQRYYEHGPSLLQRYLPFWMADMIDRLKVMLIPLIGLLFPLLKIAPPTYRWRIRSKIYRWYKDLQKIEAQGLESENREELKDLLSELDRIEKEAKQTLVPLSYADSLYDLRLHIKLVREHIKDIKASL